MGTLLKIMMAMGLDTKEFDDGLDDAEAKAAKSGKSIGSSLASVGGSIVKAGTAAAVAGIGAVAATATKAVDSTLEWAETLDGVGDVLGTSAQESAGLAVAIQGVGGDVGLMTNQMTILTRGLLNAKGEIGPTGTVLQQLGIAFQDANGNILPTTDILTAVADKVGNMPDGLEKTALMTDLFGKSGKDLSDVLGALANGGLTAANDKAKAMGLVMSDDAVNGAIMLGRKMNDLKMGFQGFLIQIGTGILPLLTSLGETLTKAMADPKIQKGISDIAAGIAQFASTAITYIPVVIEALAGVGSWLAQNKGVIVAAFAMLAAAVAAWAYTTIAAAIPAAIAFITAMWPVILVVAAIGAAVYLLYTAWTENWGGIREVLASVVVAVRKWFTDTVANFQKFLQWIQNVVNRVKTGFKALIAIFTELPKALKQYLVDAFVKAVSQVIDVVAKMVSNVLNAISAFVNSMVAYFKNLWNTIVNGVKAAWTAINDAIKGAINKVLDDIFSAMDKLDPEWRADWEKIKVALKQKWDDMIQAVKDAWNNIMTAIKTAIDNILSTLQGWANKIVDAVQSWWNGVKNAVSGAWSSISSAVSSAINSVVSTISGFVTSVTNAVGSWWTGVKNAVSGAWSSIVSAVSTAISPVTSTISGYMKSMVDAAATWWDGIKSAVTTKWEEIKTAVGTAITGAVSKVKSFYTDMFNAGKSIVQGIIDGFNNLYNAVVQAAADLALAILQRLKNLLGLGSPSKVATQYGEWFVTGLANGIKGSMDLAVGAMTDLGEALTPDVSLSTLAPEALGSLNGRGDTVINHNERFEIFSREQPGSIRNALTLTQLLGGAA